MNKIFTISQEDYKKITDLSNDVNDTRMKWEIIRDVLNLNTDNFVFCSDKSASDSTNSTLEITILD